MATCDRKSPRGPRGGRSEKRSARAAETLNERMTTLYAMVRAIGSEHALERVLDISKRELTTALSVKGITVKLLDDHGKRLRYAAVHGLPRDFDATRSVSVDESTVNRRVISGEPFVTGDVAEGEEFQFGEELAAAGIKSVMLAPLTHQHKVLGILGAYCAKSDRFTEPDIEFFELAAGLLAVAIENARSHESVAGLSAERARFMLRVAHNLRAPLAATASMVDVLRRLHLGDLNDHQAEYLRRIDRRIRVMATMIDQLLTLSKTRNGENSSIAESVDLELLTGRLIRTFEPMASRKGLQFRIEVPERLPPVTGSSAFLEQVFENLVSNAIKYTPKGSVVVRCTAEPDFGVRVAVRDTGIGVPESDVNRLFEDFFRARNARDVEEIGTGLGLALAKEMVERLGGRISVETVEDEGSVFTVLLPTSEEEHR